MKVNGKARIEITHSTRGLRTITKTWAALGFEWFGAKNPALPGLLKSLHETGKGEYPDAAGTLYFVAKDPLYVSEESE